jgi:hypothetical protein
MQHKEAPQVKETKETREARDMKKVKIANEGDVIDVGEFKQEEVGPSLNLDDVRGLDWRPEFSPVKKFVDKGKVLCVDK